MAKRLCASLHVVCEHYCGIVEIVWPLKVGKALVEGIQGPSF